MTDMRTFREPGSKLELPRGSLLRTSISLLRRLHGVGTFSGVCTRTYYVLSQGGVGKPELAPQTEISILRQASLLNSINHHQSPP